MRLCGHAVAASVFLLHIAKSPLWFCWFFQKAMPRLSPKNPQIWAVWKTLSKSNLYFFCDVQQTRSKRQCVRITWTLTQNHMSVVLKEVTEVFVLVYIILISWRIPRLLEYRRTTTFSSVYFSAGGSIHVMRIRGRFDRVCCTSQKRYRFLFKDLSKLLNSKVFLKSFGAISGFWLKPIYARVRVRRETIICVEMALFWKFLFKVGRYVLRRLIDGIVMLLWKGLMFWSQISIFSYRTWEYTLPGPCLSICTLPQLPLTHTLNIPPPLSLSPSSPSHTKTPLVAYVHPWLSYSDPLASHKN